MQYSHRNNILKQFVNNQTGSTPTRLALMFAAATVVGTVIFMPMINTATQRIVHNGLGVDYMTTASTRQSQKKYIIRKSVFNQKGSVICLEGNRDKCIENGN